MSVVDGSAHGLESAIAIFKTAEPAFFGPIAPARIAAKTLDAAQRRLNENELFDWKHAWVPVGGELIDANVDCLSENPVVSREVDVRPYWGPISDVPKDRRFSMTTVDLPRDDTIDGTWWPELRARLKNQEL